MKKTLLLTHEYYPYRGGVARYCYNLFKFLDKNDYLVITDNPTVKTADNIINIKLVNSFLKPSWLTSFFPLKKLVRQHKIEQIITPNILPLGSLAYFMNLFFKIPYVISLHGLDIILALKNKPKLTKKILKKAKGILVNSQSTSKYLDNIDLDKNKISLIYPTVDIKRDYNEEKLKDLKNKLRLKDDDKVLLTVGRLNRRKGQDLVIKAIAILPEKNNLKYFIVGKGDEKKELEELIVEYNLQNQVYIFDDVDDENLIYYYKIADIFIMPHRHAEDDVEGFGIVFLEAASFKLPIIAGQSGGAGEIFTDGINAILLHNEDLESLKQAIQSLLNNPQKADKLATQALFRFNEFPKAKEQSLKLKEILQ